MSITYDLADAEVNKLVSQIMARREPELDGAGVTVQVLFACSDNGSPAVKVAGYPCAGKVKINSLQLRVEGLPDATITLDGDQWQDWPPRRREAVLAHKLHHLTVQKDDQGKVKVDDAGRPKLKMRLHDHQIGVFESIMDDYREDAVDTDQVKPLLEYAQKVFAFWG